MTNVKLRPTDQKLLVQIAERSGDQILDPLLRRQAIKALAQFRDLDAATALARLAGSELEHQSVRISALSVLRTLSSDLAHNIDVGYQKIEITLAGKRKKGAPPQDKR